MSYHVYTLAHNLPAMLDYIIYTFIFLDSRQYADGELFELTAYPANCVCLNQCVGTITLPPCYAVIWDGNYNGFRSL